jgi:hypothetical protein
VDNVKLDQELTELKGFIDFLNRQVGVYMDCLAGFQGNTVRVERQANRVLRPARLRRDENGQHVVVWTSLEDPSRPDVIHQRVMRSADFIADNSERGFNERQVCWSIIVFVFARWDEEVRPRIAAIRGVPANEVKLDAFGDLRTLRRTIVHGAGMLTEKEHSKLATMQALFRPGDVISPSHDEMHRIFILLKQAIAELILEQTGHLPGAPVADQIRGIAITSN